MSKLQSTFSQRLVDYIKLRRQLGLRFDQQEKLLHAFDRYVHERSYQGQLTEQLAREFASSVADTSTTVPARRYLVVRHFAEYLATFDPDVPRLDPKAICRSKTQPPPYIFTEEELERLVRCASTFSQRHFVSNRAFQTLIGLAASTGMRLREVLSLDVSDVDLGTGVLVVRQSKFNKDRLVPIHPSTLDVLRGYGAVRGQMLPPTDETAFFLNARGRRYKRHNVEYLFRQLTRKIELHPPQGRPPTFYSLRHSFAVRRLVTWYQEGANVQALLPTLATYMGHVHYTSTSYYLTATAELLGQAAEKLAVHRGGTDGHEK